MAEGKTGDGLWRWILGGLAAGAVVLGLLVAAYEIGYDRGQDEAEAPAAATAPRPTETTPAPEPVALGEELWTSTGCAGCHSIDGTKSVGPTVKGLVGSTVTLDEGRTVTADEAYLARSITDPDAELVEGYDAGVMSAATDPQEFETRPQDVEALVAYIEAQR
jgi:cytochrome c2